MAVSRCLVKITHRDCGYSPTVSYKTCIPLFTPENGKNFRLPFIYLVTKIRIPQKRVKDYIEAVSQDLCIWEVPNSKLGKAICCPISRLRSSPSFSRRKLGEYFQVNCERLFPSSHPIRNHLPTTYDAL